MLMDNKGAAGGYPVGGEFLNTPEVKPAGEVDYEQFLNSGENLTPQAEAPVEMNAETEAVVGEVAAEQTPVAAPMPADEPAEVQSAEMQAVEQIEIPRDAENIPKNYADAVAKVIQKDKEDPNQLCSDVDKMRWDLMKKAFGRNRGDGLHGSTANG